MWPASIGFRLLRQHARIAQAETAVMEHAPPRGCVLARFEMSVRPPQTLSIGSKRETGWSTLDHEILQQKAQTLGNLGSQVEQALAALRAFDAGAHGADRHAQRCAL